MAANMRAVSSYAVIATAKQIGVRIAVPSLRTGVARRARDIAALVCAWPLCRDGDGEINEEEFLRIMRKTSLY